MSIGERIKAARKAADLNQSELARAAGVTPTVISCYEAGLYKPRADTVGSLAKVLGVSSDYLTYGDDQEDDEEVAEEVVAPAVKTVPEVLAKAKAEIAALLGVPLNKVRLDMSITG